MHELFGNERYLAHMSLGAVAHQDVLRSIALFGTEVAPLVRAEVARRDGREERDRRQAQLGRRGREQPGAAGDDRRVEGGRVGDGERVVVPEPPVLDVPLGEQVDQILLVDKGEVRQPPFRHVEVAEGLPEVARQGVEEGHARGPPLHLSLIHISEPTRPY